MYARISPVSVWPGTATQLRIGGAALTGFGEQGCADVLWTLSDDAQANLRTNSTRMPPQAYASWTGQDADLFAWLAGELDLTVVEIVDEPPPSPPITFDPNAPAE